MISSLYSLKVKRNTVNIFIGVRFILEACLPIYITSSEGFFLTQSKNINEKNLDHYIL